MDEFPKFIAQIIVWGGIICILFPMAMYALWLALFYFITANSNNDREIKIYHYDRRRR